MNATEKSIGQAEERGSAGRDQAVTSVNGQAADEGDSIVVFETKGPRAAKLVTDQESRGPERAKIHDAREIPIEGLSGIFHLITEVINDPTKFVVRGGLIDGPFRKGIRRLLNPDQRDGASPTVRDVPRRWVAIDLDSFDLPNGTDLRDLVACAEAGAINLPVEFLGCRAIVMATGSHGVKPGARIRLFYWLSRLTSNDELKAWFSGCPFVDHSVFSAVEPIFTAAPVFESGRKDHLPERLGWLKGEDTVQVPPINVPPKRERSSRAPRATADTADIRAALALIPNKARAWNDWSRIGMAIHASSGGSDEGFDEFCRWSAESDKHDIDECRDRWDHWASCPPDHLTFGSLVYEARLAVPGWMPSGKLGRGLEAAQGEFEALVASPPRSSSAMLAEASADERHPPIIPMTRRPSSSPSSTPAGFATSRRLGSGTNSTVPDTPRM